MSSERRGETMCQAGERKSRSGHGSDGNQVICIEERRVSIDLENKTSGGGFKLTSSSEAWGNQPG